MSILLNKDTRVLVQGITGKTGRIQTKLMLDYGTKIVAGVTPGKGGEVVEGVPVYDTVAEAVTKQGAQASLFFVPPAGVKDARNSEYRRRYKTNCNSDGTYPRPRRHGNRRIRCRAGRSHHWTHNTRYYHRR